MHILFARLPHPISSSPAEAFTVERCVQIVDTNFRCFEKERVVELKVSTLTFLKLLAILIKKTRWNVTRITLVLLAPPTRSVTAFDNSSI